MAQLLEASLSTIHAAGEAGQAYQRQLDGRLSSLPADVAEGISPEAIARAITESLRQQFVQSGLPATANALTAISHQLTEATGQFQRTAGQLSACAGRAEEARRASDQMSASVAKATETARSALETVRHGFRLYRLVLSATDVAPRIYANPAAKFRGRFRASSLPVLVIC